MLDDTVQNDFPRFVSTQCENGHDFLFALPEERRLYDTIRYPHECPVCGSFYPAKDTDIQRRNLYSLRFDAAFKKGMGYLTLTASDGRWVRNTRPLHTTLIFEAMTQIEDIERYDDALLFLIQKQVFTEFSTPFMPSYLEPSQPHVLGENDTEEHLLQIGFQKHRSHGYDYLLPPMCTIPSGPFLMGSNKDHDVDAWILEIPQHSLRLETYSMSKYPVTAAEYGYAILANVVKEPKASSLWWKWWAGQQQRLTFPVINVSHEDAMAYAAWITSVTGEVWRLPTEAEWEKAARGTDNRIFPWGDQFDMSFANTEESRFDQTTPIDTYTKAASPYDVQDMIGNVSEWCNSRFTPYPDSPYAQNDRFAYLADHIIVKGGSYAEAAVNSRISVRQPLKPNRPDIGFRLVKEQ